MTKRCKIPAVVSTALLCCALAAASAWAGPRFTIGVTTVLASQKGHAIDPSLAPMTRELQSIFRYTSYRLLGRDRVVLGLHESGSVALPGNRVLAITPQGVSAKRALLRLVMHKNRRRIFQTRIQLINHGSIIVGGPRFRNGVLLFKISSAF